MKTFFMGIAFSLVYASIAQEGTKKEKDTMRIMTFNIWVDGQHGKQPLSKTSEVIKASKADIAGLQEVRKNAKAIADILGWHHLQHGSDTAVISRFEIIGATEDKLGVKLRHDSGRIMYVFNVHLMHAPYQPYQLLNIPYANAPFLKTEEEAITAAKKARGHEMKHLIEAIKTIDHKETPVFITGDFNEPSHRDWTQAASDAGIHPMKVSYPTTLALEKAGFIDAYRAVYPDEIKHPGFTWTPLTTRDDPKDHHDRIDFIFCSGQGMKVKDVKLIGEDPKHADIIVTPFPSDHRAVVATFQIPNTQVTK